MPNLTILLSATLSVTNTTLSPSPTPVSTNLNNPSLTATVSFYDSFYQVGVGASNLVLPATIIYVCYVKNLHTTNNILVTVTPNGGTAGSGEIIAPGGVYQYFQATENAGTAISGVTNGLTAVTLTASGASTSAEILLAA